MLKIRHLWTALALGAPAWVRADDAGQSAAPMNYFLHSHGPIAVRTMYLGWVFAAICAAVCIIVAGLLAYAMLRRRALDADSPSNSGRPESAAGSSSGHAPDAPADALADGRAAHGLAASSVSPAAGVRRGGAGAGLKAVAYATALSTVILVGMAIHALVVLDQVARPTQPVGLHLTVTGYDWWWRVDYGDGEPAQRFATANEIHIPVGVPVRLRLNSADVIHAFWVPMLAGKTQMIPGLDNEQWLQADAPGTYRGQCTQYCGVQHAHMAVAVVAQPPAEFAAWLATQRLPVAPLPDSAGAPTIAGARLFMQRCAGCHTVRGTEAAGVDGPDLTHLNSRRMIAAGLLTNTPSHLLQWITNAQHYKPGSRMPSMPLTMPEQQDLTAFLARLD